MVSQRAAALVVFIGIIMVGLAFGLVIRSRLREKRWERHGEEATHFLSNLSQNGEGEALAGAHAVVIKKEDETTYVEDEPPEEANIVLHQGNHPQAEIIKRILENRQQRQKIAKGPVATTVRGFLEFSGIRYWMTNWRKTDDHLSADLLNADGRRMGAFVLLGRTERVITGEIHLLEAGERVTFDVFVPVNHPNITNVFSAISVEKPPSRELAVDAITRTYANATPASISARG